MNKRFEKPKLTQKGFERFFELLRERNVEADQMSAPRYAGELVQAAIDAEWMPALPTDVGFSDPREIWLIHLEIKAYVNEIFEIPKN